METQVPLQHIIPPEEDQSEAPSGSKPLPPPIHPETEDSAHSPASESSSSGYVSTSVSMATLADVYTLSWDLPPLLGNHADDSEAPPTSDAFPPSSRASDQSQPCSDRQEVSGDQVTSSGGLMEPEAEEEENNQSEPSSKQADRGPQEPALEPSSSSSSEPPPVEPPPVEPPPVEPSPVEPALEPEAAPDPMGPGESLQSGPQDPDLIQTTLEEPDQQGPVHPAEDPPDPVPVLTLTPALDQDPDPGPALEPAAPSQTPDPDPASSRPDVARTPGLLAAQTGPPTAGPFRIQKVQKMKPSDLKSFRRVLQTEDCGPGAGLNVPEPMERLEIISDSEDGGGADGAAPVPDWLREGEFVTVGTNKSGTVRYVGTTDFADGVWVGVELEVPAGTHIYIYIYIYIVLY